MPRAKQAPEKTTTRKSETPAKPLASVTQFPSPSGNNHDAGLEEQIRLRAYEIFEQRGQQHGLSEQDWLQAEAEVMARSDKRTA